MKKNKVEYGVFCELYGQSLRNLVLEYLLENNKLDFAVGDMAEELDISRPKAYQIIEDLTKKGFVIKTRIVAGTQLYMLNGKNKKVRLLLKNFRECLKFVIEEYSAKPKNYTKMSSRIGVISAKGI